MRGILGTKIRSNTGTIMLTDISNGKLLQSVWEEFYSLICDWQSFVDLFLYHLRAPGREYAMLALSTDRKKDLDVDAGHWKCIEPNIKWLLNYIDRPRKKTTKKPVRLPVDTSSSSDDET